MLGIIRLIILVALGWLAYRYIRRFLALDKPADSASGSSASRANQNAEQNAEQNQQSLPMQRCSYCQVHLPEGESTRSSGHYFCSETHRDAWLEANPKDH
ncbi:MAG: PP0621 family protein [Paraperlucidibaca sp.]